jgi:hypothetical protein
MGTRVALSNNVILQYVLCSPRFWPVGTIQRRVQVQSGQMKGEKEQIRAVWIRSVGRWYESAVRVRGVGRWYESAVRIRGVGRSGQLRCVSNLPTTPLGKTWKRGPQLGH